MMVLQSNKTKLEDGDMKDFFRFIQDYSSMLCGVE